MSRYCVLRGPDRDHVGSIVDDYVYPLDTLVSPIEATSLGIAALLGTDPVEVANAATAARAAAVPLAEANLRAPFPIPARNLFCVGKNYRDHAAEFTRSEYDDLSGGSAEPTHPIVFTKPPSAVIGPGDSVDAHQQVTRELDYEAEVAAIIGRGGRGIDAAQAMDHVWGYTLINDVTARDLQRRHQQWFLGKSLDTFCPMGPWATTADEVDLATLTLECRVNGEIRQSARTAELIFDVATLIATISAGISLQAGDLIATGTPAGVGIGFDPPRFLASGDVVEVAAAGLGTLTNPVT